jgi:MFS family permease
MLNVPPNNYNNILPLQKEQKEAIALLSIGTFLEHFDLLLYIHMIPLLNETFFPKTDPKSATILSTLVFCSIYICRPIGAIIFGYIGDNFGRKTPVIITTAIMALSCVTIANLKSYSEIGIAATWIITMCRIGQGMSSMGEIVGAEIYLTESIKPPLQYSAVSLMAFFAGVGCTAALGIASLVTSFGFNWRLGFWFGGCIALVGIVARTTLKETKDFANAQFRIKNHLQKNNITTTLLQNNPVIKEKINKTIILTYSLIHCGWPLCFYLSYIYCGNILKNSFGYTIEQVIHHNFILSIVQLFGFFFLRIYLSRKIDPLKILKVILWIFSGFIVFVPYLLNNLSNPFVLFIIQTLILVFAIDMAPATSIFYSYFPIFKRFTYAGLAFGTSRAIINVIIPFGCIYLTEKYGYYALMGIILPITAGYTFAIYYFDNLNKVIENYRKKKNNVAPLTNITEAV